MFNRKKSYLFILGFLLFVCIFLTSYVVSLNKFNIDSKNNEENSVYYQDPSLNNIKDTANIIFKVKNSTNNSFKELSRISALNLKEKLGKNLNKNLLEGYYLSEGFRLYSFKEDEIVFVKDDASKFEPNKYYIGVERGYVAIFKADSSGQLYIEDKTKDITTKLLDTLPEGDKIIIKNFELKFDNRDEAEEQLIEIQS